MRTIIIGARGSQLATTQTKWVIDAIQAQNLDVKIELKIVKTTGDLDQKTDLVQFQGLGVFVKELQAELLNKTIDCAVHSLKDVPENCPEALTLACFPKREDVRDCFISNQLRFLDLPKGAKVGTGSPRRIMQLHQMRPDIQYVPMRGNLDTRIQKVRKGELDGILLAMAGLNRLNQSNEVTHPFELDQMVPAIGQGCLALECRKDDAETIAIVRKINDLITENAVLLERRFMKLIGGGCKAPMACHVSLSSSVKKSYNITAILGDIPFKKVIKFEKLISEDEMEKELSQLIREFESGSKVLNIPLPHQLPKDHLLDYLN